MFSSGHILYNFWAFDFVTMWLYLQYSFYFTNNPLLSLQLECLSYLEHLKDCCHPGYIYISNSVFISTFRLYPFVYSMFFHWHNLHLLFFQRVHIHLSRLPVTHISLIIVSCDIICSAKNINIKVVYTSQQKQYNISGMKTFVRTCYWTFNF